MFIKRDKKDDCIIAGFVVSDQKEKEFEGKKLVEIGVAIGKDINGENLPIVNVSIWGRTLPQISKGDRVFACGKLKVTVNGDKTYYSLTSDYVSKEQSIKDDYVPECCKEIDDDSDLPF